MPCFLRLSYILARVSRRASLVSSNDILLVAACAMALTILLYNVLPSFDAFVLLASLYGLSLLFLLEPPEPPDPPDPEDWLLDHADVLSVSLVLVLVFDVVVDLETSFDFVVLLVFDVLLVEDVP